MIYPLGCLESILQCTGGVYNVSCYYFKNARDVLPVLQINYRKFDRLSLDKKFAKKQK